MNKVPVSRLCLYCEAVPAATIYGLCATCDRISALRRVYKKGRGRSPEWEAHLLALTERAKQGLPLFVEGQPSPHRPGQRLRKDRDLEHVPRVRRITLPRRERSD